jgi:hypothetical protein
MSGTTISNGKTVSLKTDEDHEDHPSRYESQVLGSVASTLESLPSIDPHASALSSIALDQFDGFRADNLPDRPTSLPAEIERVLASHTAALTTQMQQQEASLRRLIDLIEKDRWASEEDTGSPPGSPGGSKHNSRQTNPSRINDQYVGGALGGDDAGDIQKVSTDAQKTAMHWLKVMGPVISAKNSKNADQSHASSDKVGTNASFESVYGSLETDPEGAEGALSKAAFQIRSYSKALELSKMKQSNVRATQNFAGKKAWKPLCTRLVEHRFFEQFFGFMIFANAVFIGAQMEYNSMNDTNESPILMEHLNNVFTFSFAVELVARLIGDWRFFLFGPNWNWSLLDIFVVSTSVMEFCFQVAVDSESGELRNLSAFRLLRVLRIFSYPESC